MDQADLLDRQFNTFIGLDDPKDFFIGMTDYLEFVDKIPAFENISQVVYSEKKPLQEKVGAAEPLAMMKIKQVRDELFKYVQENKVLDETVKRAFEHYDHWLDGRIQGSSTLTAALYDSMREVIEMLYRFPEHREFLKKYMEFSSHGNIRYYLALKEYFDYDEAASELYRQNETSLWGQMTEISWLYQIIKRGRERQKKLAEEHNETQSTKAFWNAINHKLLLEEWQGIESGSNRQPHFFKVPKIRLWLTRFHNRLLSDYVLGATSTRIAKETIRAVLTTIQDQPIPSSFSPKLILKNNKGYLQIFKYGKKHLIAGISTRQFRLIKCLFSPDNNLNANYNPVFQSYERIFEAILLKSDSKNTLLTSPATATTEKIWKIKTTIKEIQKIKSLQGNLKFEWDDQDRLRLQITLPEGLDKIT